jgi:hypothetical protein
MQCKDCGREIPDDAILCPYCGKRVLEDKPAVSRTPEPPPAKRSSRLPGLITVIILGVVVTVACCAASGEIFKDLYGTEPTATSQKMAAATKTPSPTPPGTPTPTRTPMPSPTPPPTPTPTPVPRVGTVLRCGDVFEAIVPEPPQFLANTDDETAVGVFLVVQMELTNLTNRTYEALFEESYAVRGVVDGRELEFVPHRDASWDMYWQGRNSGVGFFTHDVPPGVPFHTVVVFDVHPDGKDWTLIFSPGKSWFSSGDCSVEALLE